MEEAEIGVTLPQVKECLQPPELAEAGRELSLGTLKGNVLPTP